MKKRINTIFLILLIISVSFGIMSTYFCSTGVILIVNKANQQIQSFCIEVCNQSFKLENIPKGATQAVLYEIWGDSHYTIKTIFDSGKILKLESGYVTSSLDSVDRFNVEEDMITHEFVQISNAQ